MHLGLAEPTQSWPNELGCLAGRFYGLHSRISNKIYSEPLMHALSHCDGPAESFFQFYCKSTGRAVDLQCKASKILGPEKNMAVKMRYFL